MKKLILGLCLCLSFNVFATVKEKKVEVDKINKVFSLQEAENYELNDEKDSLIIDLTKHKERIRVKSFSKRIVVATLGFNKFLIRKRNNEKGYSSIFFEFEKDFKIKEEHLNLEVK